LPGGTTIQSVIRITNNGGSALTITKSKPPEGAELGAVNPSTDLHEGTHILPNTSALGLVSFEPLVSNILNQLPRDISGQWTLNTDGLDFGGPYEVKFHGTAITTQVGPKFANGSSIYRYLGCYKDSTAKRIEPNNFINQTSNENGLCQETCKKGNWAFAGTEYNWECWCGNFIPDDSLLSDNSLCTSQCSGDQTQVCGGLGGYASFYYDVTRYDPVTKAFDGIVGKGIPHIVQSAGNFTYQGCYSEATSGRALSQSSISSVNVNVQFCANYCKAYTYFGVEYGRECYCGNTLAATSTKKPDTDCSMFCAADEFAYCGAGGRLGLYQKGVGSTSSSAVTSTTSAPVTSTTTTSTTTTTTAGPTGTANYTYIACWADNDLGNRTLQGKTIQDQGDSPDFCHTFCAGFAYFGLEYGYECWCGDVVRDASEQRPETECNMPCTGDETKLCGAGYRLSLYHNVPPAPANTTTSTTTVIATITTPTNTTTVIATTTTPANTTTVLSTTTNPVNTTITTTSTTTAIGTTTLPVNTTTIAVGDTTSVTTTSTTTAPTATSISTYLGCWTDTVGNRTLRAKTFRNANITVESCEASCLPYGAYYGVEYSNECFCGKLLEGPTTKRNETECNMKCAGNANETCGGSNRLNLYIYNRNLTTTTTTTTTTLPATDLTTAVTTTTAGITSTTSTTSTTHITSTTSTTDTTSTTNTTSTTTTGVVTTTATTTPVGDANFGYYGCYTDKVGARVLASWGIPASATMTIEKCLTGCSQYEFAGLEYGRYVALITTTP